MSTQTTSLVVDKRLTPEQLAKLDEELRLIEQAARDAPLAFSTLWHRSQPRTSQRRAARAMLAIGVDTAMVLGGNRSGKSELGAQIGVAYALGRSHPHVVRWAALNRLDLRAIPTRPGRVCAVALTSSDSKRYMRSKYAKYLPSGGTWRNQHGDGEATWTGPKGETVVFKSVDQGRRAMQGDDYDLVHCDEEPDDPEVIAELEMRLVDRRGRMILTMTPLSGWTPLLERLARAPGPTTAITYLHGVDNPHVPADELQRRLDRYGEHERQARARGEITALEGRVYDLRRDLHIVQTTPTGVGYVGIDWGTSVPTAMLLAIYDESRDILTVIDEVYREGMTIAERADALAEMEARHKVKPALRWADPEDASTMRSLILDYDVELVKATKAVSYGVSVTAQRLRPDVLGVPHLQIHARCVNLIRELDALVWQRGKDAPRKAHDHACDALRYLCVGVAQTYGLAPPLDAAA